MKLTALPYPDTHLPQSGMPSTGVSAFLAWCWAWLQMSAQAGGWETPAPKPRQEENGLWAYTMNRNRRRKEAAGVKLGYTRTVRSEHIFTRERHTPAQNMEKHVRQSPHGRVKMYRMIYWAKVQGRWANTAFQHRHSSGLDCGLWDAHALPG